MERRQRDEPDPPFRDHARRRHRVRCPRFGWPSRSAIPAGNTAIGLAVLALLSLAVFWLWPTLVVAVGAVAAGLGGSKEWAR